MPKIPKQTLSPDAGMLLIAGANLLDSNFARTIILLCEHRYEGSFGLVLNQPTSLHLTDVIQDVADWDTQIYSGGPVQENTLHFIHRCPKLEIGSREIFPGVYWGGDFEALNRAVAAKHVDPSDLRFFTGYSGWSEGQLDNEIKRDSWYLSKAKVDTVFHPDSPNHWRHIFKTMGSEYSILASFPDDPRLN